MGLDMLWSIRGKSRRKIAAKHYALLTRAALTPDLYEKGAALDTFEGRAAMMTTHASVIFYRLKQIETSQSRKISDAINTLILDGMDAAYRELGVGDSSIARKVRKLAEVHYGLGQALIAILEMEESEQLEALVKCFQRNHVSEPGKETALARYMQHNAQRFKQMPDAIVLTPEMSWTGISEVPSC